MESGAIPKRRPLAVRQFHSPDPDRRSKPERGRYRPIPRSLHRARRRFLLRDRIQRQVRIRRRLQFARNRIRRHAPNGAFVPPSRVQDTAQWRSRGGLHPVRRGRTLPDGDVHFLKRRRSAPRRPRSHKHSRARRRQSRACRRGPFRIHPSRKPPEPRPSIRRAGAHLHAAARRSA